MAAPRIGIAGIALAALFVGAPARAEGDLPPWRDRSELPLPAWARSVAPTREDAPIYVEPGELERRRGSAQPDARLPIYGSRRAGGCVGRWLAVGPLAWMCSDTAEVSADAPLSPALGARPWLAPGEAPVDYARPPRPGARRASPPLGPVSGADDGLPYRYYFAGRGGAYGFLNLATAPDEAPSLELEPGFAVAVVEEQRAHGERWARTNKGHWIALRELVAARPSAFHGELLDEGGELDIAWVRQDKAPVFASESATKATGARVRFETVRVFEERSSRGGAVVRVSPDGEAPAWIRARDLARPRLSAPPPEVRAEGVAERWIDVDLKEQTLVAYEGARPVFATLVSTGKGSPRSGTATRKGTFRIWVKLFTTKMSNLDSDDVARHYAIEDVPWVQFFDKAIGLHAAFWHQDFGRVRSQGCVNLAPLDARWLFAFTAPNLPRAWTAVHPTDLELGTVVRVR